MYLSSVDIIGFKSFAQKTSLGFEGGLSAIVGPNGCGKTNIVDAIRWALGEQKTSVLRSDAMENVIFNGTRTRRPVGLAEVSLTIQNNRNILPTEYSEVTLTRRLYRNGESQYFLNKTQCRLRDIIDLFMDTGMGADAYSVIELKMIEKILSDRTDDRRHLFEEAAGVTKYKARRKETRRRIESIKADVERVQDIMREVQKTVYTLQRQAEKAKLHGEITDELRQTETWILHHDYVKIDALLVAKKAELIPLLERKTELEKALYDAEQARIALEAEAEQFEAEMRELQSQLNDSSKHLAAMSQQKAVSIERIKAFSEAIVRAMDQAKEAEHAKSDAMNSLEKSKERIAELHAQCDALEAEVKNLREAREEVRTKAQELRGEAKQYDEILSILDKTIAERRSASDRASERIAGLERRIAETDGEISGTKQSLAHVIQEIASNSQEQERFANSLREAEVTLQDAQEQSAELQSRIGTLTETIANKQNEKGRLTASIEFLSNLVETKESSVFLSTSKTWNPASGKVTLAEIINADESIGIAIEAALGDAGGYFVVDTIADAQEGCAELEKASKGKASFLCREFIPTSPAPGKQPSQSGIIGWASEIVSVDDSIRNAIRLLLGKTLIVESADLAKELRRTYPDFTCITLRGEIYGAEGIIRGGSISSSEGKRIGRREQIAKQQKALDALSKEIETLLAEIASTKTQYDAIDIKKLTEQVRKAEYERNVFEQGISKLRYRKEALEAAREKQDETLHNLNEELTAFKGNNSSLHEAMDDVNSKRFEADELKKAILTRIQDTDNQLINSENAFRQSEIALVQKRGEERSVASEIRRLEEIISQKTEQVHYLNDEQERAGNEQSMLESSMNAVASDLVEEEERVKSLQEAISQRQDKARDFKERRQQVRNAEGEIRSLEHAITEQVHATELSLQQAQIEFKRILEKVEEQYPEIDLGNLPESWTLPQDFDEFIEKEKARKLSNRLQNLGNVNFLALEEYEKEHERLEFLKSQLADLSQAEESLQATMDEINQTAQQRFNETFEQIRGHFKDLFATLFSGRGEAEIHLGEGDPLECSIEITAKPPGKRPQSIELLSAGEKTLTAIALLFAIYLVKPSPFCILDEVDAPLDDANIDRYLQLIKSFSEKTQFLMITHNKKTMEAADTLYGVTQEEEGVSKVVSVRLTGS
ncbi:MAG: chromosome segregation protein SMC [Candidatus Kapaibacteriota bacterium]